MRRGLANEASQEATRGDKLGHEVMNMLKIKCPAYSVQKLMFKLALAKSTNA